LPEVVYVALLQFQVYVLQAVAEDDDVELALIVKSKVAVFKQPKAFIDVQV
jgi:hypothetical protein